MWLEVGGFACGFLAGGGARYGRLCTMTAIEDAVISRDFRAAKAWGLALAVALLVAQTASRRMGFDFENSVYGSGRIDLAGALTGGVLFGLGMALVGTCSFGLLVRAGSGDLRALISAGIVGIAAFAFTGGMLSQARLSFGEAVQFDAIRIGGKSFAAISKHALGGNLAVHQAAWPVAVAALLLLLAALDARLRRRPRMLLASAVLGLAVGCGWIVTATAVDVLETARLESLSFVGAVGRVLMQIMTGGMRDVGFGMASVAGVVAGAFAVSAAKSEIRSEAFDDFREMRRHVLGAVLMGLGGVLARGCTIGQGMSAASALLVSAPVVITGVLIGARIGLWSLLEGRIWLSRWRANRPAS